MSLVRVTWCIITNQAYSACLRDQLSENVRIHMKSPLRAQVPLTVLTALLVAPTPVLPQAQAQSTSEPPPLEQFTKLVVDRTCAKQATDLIGALDATLIFETRKPDIAQVCRCTEQGMLRDTRLVQHWAVGTAGRAQRLNLQQSKVYFTTRLYQALYSCIATEVDRGLTAFNLPK